MFPEFITGLPNGLELGFIQGFIFVLITSFLNYLSCVDSASEYIYQSLKIFKARYSTFNLHNFGAHVAHPKSNLFFTDAN